MFLCDPQVYQADEWGSYCPTYETPSTACDPSTWLGDCCKAQSKSLAAQFYDDNSFYANNDNSGPRRLFRTCSLLSESVVNTKTNELMNKVANSATQADVGSMVSADTITRGYVSWRANSAIAIGEQTKQVKEDEVCPPHGMGFA